MSNRILLDNNGTKSNIVVKEVTMEPDEESNYTSEEESAYQKIKKYVKGKCGVNVYTEYVVVVKWIYRMKMRKI